jgi:hypothetical protein
MPHSNIFSVLRRLVFPGPGICIPAIITVIPGSRTVLLYV